MLSYTNCPELTEGWVKCKGWSPYTLKKITKTQYCNIPRHSFSSFLSAAITQVFLIIRAHLGHEQLLC